MDKKPILNKVKQRHLILSPTVKECLEKEGSKSDFFREGDRPIGKGGFGEVWKVIHKATNKLYCIKVIAKRSIVEQKMVEQMNREIEIMYKLNHPHIVKLVSHFEDDDSFYLIMNYASKGQLYTHLKKAGRFDQKTAAQYLRETIYALQFLHSFDPPIIHRDIKPENILLDENNRVKLADFGWSNYQTIDKERKTYCGTPEYLAPEMLYKKGHDKSVDIWSVGVLMFELLCGSSPFASSSQEELFSNIKKHKINWPNDFPHLAKNLINKILKPNPNDRISLEEILSHVWFEQNPPLYKPLEFPSNDPKLVLESHLLSIKPENIQKEINKVVEKINNLRVTRNTIMNESGSPAAPKAIQQGMHGFGDGTSKNNFTPTTNQNSTGIYLLEQQVINLTKENSELKKKCEAATGELLKLEQSKNRDAATIKTYEQENINLRQDLDKYIMLNKDRINVLAELEEKSNKLIEQDCKIKAQLNEILFLKESLQDLQSKNTELKDQNSKLEDKYVDFKKKFFEQTSSKEEVINEYREKLEVLQSKLFETNNKRNSMSSGSSTMYDSNDNLLEILNENISEFKKLFSTKITNITLLLTEIREEYNLSEKAIKGSIEQKSCDIQELLNKLSKRIDDEVSKFLNYDAAGGDTTKKNNKEIWLNEQVHELQPYKTKFLNIEMKLKKAENEVELYKNKCNTLDDLYLETKKINQSKTDELKHKIEEINNIEAKLSDIKDFVFKHCPNKLDEFHQFFKN